MNKEIYYQEYMDIALKEAKKAYKNGDVPVGAVLIDESGKIIAKGFNKKEKDNDVTKHAEIIVIKKANKILNNWRLENLTLVVTLSPCLMCLGAIIASRIKKVVIGCKDNKLSDKENIILNDLYFDNNIEILKGIKENECKKILNDFFNKKR